MAVSTLAEMALQVGDNPVHRLTVQDVMAMLEHGLLGEHPEHVELLNGVLVEKMGKGKPHELIKERVIRWLAPGLTVGAFRIRAESPLETDRYSMPEPDVMVLGHGNELDRPTTALLAVEVAHTSLRTDLDVKAPMYARAGVPEYWVIDAAGRALIVHTDPEADGYGVRRTVRPPATHRPQAVEVEPLDLGQLFDGLG